MCMSCYERLMLPKGGITMLGLLLVEMGSVKSECNDSVGAFCFKKNDIPSIMFGLDVDIIYLVGLRSE